MEDNIFRFLIRFVTAEFFALLGFLFGAWDGLMKALVAFVIIDYITGLIAATKRRKLNSNVGFKGIAKKAMIFTIVAVCHIIDTQVVGGDKALLRSMVIGFYIANEGLSILENVGKFVKYPKKLRSFLEQLRDKNDKEDNDHGGKDV